MTTRFSPIAFAATIDEAIQRQQYRDWLVKQKPRTRQVAAAGEILTEQRARSRRAVRRG